MPSTRKSGGAGGAPHRAARLGVHLSMTGFRRRDPQPADNFPMPTPASTPRPAPSTPTHDLNREGALDPQFSDAHHEPSPSRRQPRSRRRPKNDYDETAQSIAPRYMPVSGPAADDEARRAGEQRRRLLRARSSAVGEPPSPYYILRRSPRPNAPNANAEAGDARDPPATLNPDAYPHPSNPESYSTMPPAAAHPGLALLEKLPLTASANVRIRVAGPPSQPPTHLDAVDYAIADAAGTTPGNIRRAQSQHVVPEHPALRTASQPKKGFFRRGSRKSLPSPDISAAASLDVPAPGATDTIEGTTDNHLDRSQRARRRRGSARPSLDSMRSNRSGNGSRSFRLTRKSSAKGHPNARTELEQVERVSSMRSSTQTQSSVAVPLVADHEWVRCWVELRGGFMLISRIGDTALDDADGNSQTQRVHTRPHSADMGDTAAFKSAEMMRRGRRQAGQTQGRLDRKERQRVAKLGDEPSYDPLMPVSPRRASHSSRHDARIGATRTVDHIYCVTKCQVIVTQSPSCVTMRIVGGEQNRELELCFDVGNMRAIAEEWCWALANTVSPYEGTQLQGFRIVSPLGRGAFGRVYLINDKRSSERLALKVLEKNEVFEDTLHFTSAVNERLALELMCGSPFIIQLRYSNQTEKFLYLITEFYEGGDLFNFLRNHHESLRERHAIRIIGEVILGLEAMHKAGLVYRDLKPENILLDSNGHVRIADLGLAKRLTTENRTQTVCGSLVYAGPEMLAGQSYGQAFDMWTLGIFIYQVLTGEVPFETDDVPLEDILVQQRQGQIQKKFLSDDGYSLVCDLLQSDPSKRPSFAKIKRHRFFSSIDWDMLERKEPHPDSLAPIMRVRLEQSRKEAQQKMRSPEEQQDAVMLRHFDPDDWIEMSFSDDSHEASMSSLFREPITRIRKQPEETTMIAGWSFSRPSDRWSMPQFVRRQTSLASPVTPKPIPASNDSPIVTPSRLPVRIMRRTSRKSLTPEVAG